jgi:hypothetical protein
MNIGLAYLRQLLYCYLYELRVSLLMGSLKAVIEFYCRFRGIVLVFIFISISKKDTKQLTDCYERI